MRAHSERQVTDGRGNRADNVASLDHADSTFLFTYFRFNDLLTNSHYVMRVQLSVQKHYSKHLLPRRFRFGKIQVSYICTVVVLRRGFLLQKHLVSLCRFTSILCWQSTAKRARSGARFSPARQSLMIHHVSTVRPARTGRSHANWTHLPQFQSASGFNHGRQRWIADGHQPSST
ncbi:hypothetical protein BDR07DRAFT_958800 [Suillus spraguei]|nr:hypothetical protein BDR07DRAFT_958800 [Suillus spraguei]